MTKPVPSPKSRRNWGSRLPAEADSALAAPGPGFSLPGGGVRSTDRVKPERGPGLWAGRGLVVLYLSIIVLLPLAAVVSTSLEGGLAGFWDAVSGAQAVAALKLTVISSLVVVAINAVFGTMIAWVLVRDEFPGKRAINAMIDLPFALPTIVAGLTLLTLYGSDSPLGVNIAFTKVAVVFALLFVTLPFVVRSVQPLLLEMDREMEAAAASLGAGGITIFRRIIFPNLLPGIAAGVALAFARALGEFGSLVLISGNIPFKTEVSSVFIRSQIESGNTSGAAAVSVVLLVVSLMLLAFVTVAQRWATMQGGSPVGRAISRVRNLGQIGSSGP
jgi:sulfate/thiosulfate transport system permease protein